VPEPEETISSEELESEAAQRLDLHAAVALLDERDRDLLALRYGADLKARQIAELLGERTNTIEVALHRALRRLRAVLEEPSEGRAAGKEEEQPGPAQKRTASAGE
jgi:RNA polymerase sigma-70 factor (ECF subfamily)